MPMRTRAVLVGVAFVLLVVLWFVFMFRPNQARISELRDQQTATQQEIDMLEGELTRLQGLRDREPELQAELLRLQDALPLDPRLPDFILQIHEAANLAGVDFLSITPSLPAAFTPPADAPAPPQPLQAVSVTISTTGRYFALEDFIIRIERLRRAVRINSFTLAPGGGEDPPGASPTLSVSFQMQMFVGGVPAPAAAPEQTGETTVAPTPEPAAVAEQEG